MNRLFLSFHGILLALPKRLEFNAKGGEMEREG